jgi:membrane protease YdiL (CAAX protease family)
LVARRAIARSAGGSVAFGWAAIPTIGLARGETETVNGLVLPIGPERCQPLVKLKADASLSRPSRLRCAPKMDLAASFKNSISTLALAMVIALIYVVVIRLGWKVPWREGWLRAGLTVGPRRPWIWALALLGPLLLYTYLTYSVAAPTAADVTSPYHPMLGLGLTSEVLLASLSYGLLASGFGEELVFRGLIAGALGRRWSLPWANLIQSLIFLAPHLLILLVKPSAWPLLPGVFALALMTGWLRLRSGSIGPGLLLHGLGNTFVGVLASGALPLLN